MKPWHYGTVSAVDEATMRVRVRLPEIDNLRTWWLPVIGRKTLKDKDYWLPDEGEQVVVLLDENGEDGVVLGAVFSDVDEVPVVSRDKWHRRFADGATLEYDRASHVLKVQGVERVIVEAGESIMLQAGTLVTIDAPDTACTGNLLVAGGLAVLGQGAEGATMSIQGKVQVDGDINATGKIIDAGGNSANHKH